MTTSNQIPKADQLEEILSRRAREYGIEVRSRPLDSETAGEFDGLSITLNSTYSVEQRGYYLAHSIGSIVIWSIERAWAEQTYGELRAAKRAGQPARLDAALEAFAEFEEEASRYAVWLLEDVGRSDVVRDYTVFARADLDMMRQFHRTGAGRIWSEIYPRWKDEVAKGVRELPGYEPKPIPAFNPAKIETQTVLQERDGQPE